MAIIIKEGQEKERDNGYGGGLQRSVQGYKKKEKTKKIVEDYKRRRRQRRLLKITKEGEDKEESQ